jgi:CxxC motif-containing protein
VIKELICIECPKSCSLKVDIENCRIVKVNGNQCPRGQDYAKTEIENPLRILTGVVLTNGLAIKMVPVRTDKPIPKDRILEAAAEIKKLKVTNPLGIGDIVVSNFMGLAVNLIATRDVL